MEFMDVYDADRRPRGLTRARGGTWQPGEYFVVVHLCIFNSRGELLLQRRAADKKGWPDLWDLSVGGCSQAGETSAQAIRRETLEELGLNLDIGPEDRYYTFCQTDCFDDYYLLHRDVALTALTLQAEEVQDVRWATLEDVLALLEAGRFMPLMPQVVQLLFAGFGHRGTLTGGVSPTGSGGPSHATEAQL